MKNVIVTGGLGLGFSTNSTGLFVIKIPISFCPTTIALEINFRYFPTVVVDFPAFKRSSLKFASLTAVSVLKY